MIHYVLRFYGHDLDVTKDTFTLALNALSQEYDVRSFQGYTLAGNNTRIFVANGIVLGQIISVDDIPENILC